MSMKIVRSLEVRFFFFLFIRNEEKCINKRKDTREGKGVRIFLEWGVMDDKDTARGGVVFWNYRMLELVGMEAGGLSISYHLKYYEDGFVWIFMRVYGQTIRREIEFVG